MLMLTRSAAIAVAATLGVALSAPSAVTALAGAAQSNTAMQGHATPPIQSGDLVRLRSGGPVLTVKSVRGDWVICSWWSGEDGEFQSGGFPVAMVVRSVPPPSNDTNPETNGHIQDLPPNVVQDEKKMQSALDGAKEIVEKLETRICREC